MRWHYFSLVQKEIQRNNSTKAEEQNMSFGTTWLTLTVLCCGGTVHLGGAFQPHLRWVLSHGNTRTSYKVTYKNIHRNV
jgi:hypothetical protein